VGKSLAQPAARSNFKTFRRARLWLASLMALALGALAATFVGFVPAGRSLELAVSDMLRATCSLPAETETSPVTTIEIDDAALARAGRWPWPRPIQAEFLDALVSLAPRFIALDIEYFAPEEPYLAKRTAADGAREYVTVLNPDAILCDAVRRAGNVLVPFSVYLKDRPEARAADAAAPPLDISPALVRHALDLAPEDAPGICVAEGVHPMLPEFAEACAGSGYTSVLKDPDDALRRVPLLVHVGDRVFPHLALEMAGLARFGPDYRVRLEGGRLVLSDRDGAASVAVPVDAQGQVDLRWPRNLAVMDRIAAGPILDLVEARRELADHRSRLSLVLTELKTLFSKASDPTAAILDYRDRTPEGETDDLEVRRARAARDFLPFLASCDDREKTLAERVRRAEVRARPRVEGRIVIVGVTATAVSTSITDLHKTPISASQPGVTVYPAAMQTILSGVAFRRLPRWGAWLAAVLFAWLVAAGTSRLPTGWGVAAAVVLSVLLAAAAWLVSTSAALLLPLAGPVLAVIVAFAGVSAYRQLTEASSRRWITSLFKQYVAADHVEEILRHPELLRLGGERREITILFSDIRSFTPLSESIGPEQLGTLLNHYLSAMTDVLFAEHATLDKYEGDGIMVFFGAPVPAADHALRAVRAALAMQATLPRVNQELADLGLLPEGYRLAMRVGCSTGPAVVGRFGSERQKNYTAMGDTVNLGGRLEEANRWLGSRILVPEATRQACGDAVLFRRFGPARIRGKADPIVLYEPLALKPASPEVKAVAGAFARAVDALAAGDFSAADTAIGDCLAADPQDGPAQVLRERIEAARAGRMAPNEPWNLAQPK
jgi:class 3 adenylate cyclase/CHASE2 domain-containing sensor protein